MRKIRIGSRKSALARWQAEFARDSLRAIAPGMTIELVWIETRGDKILDRPLSMVEATLGKALFVKELEEALLDNRIDLAVHSLKDVTFESPEELKLGAILKRERPEDVLVSASGARFDSLPRSARIGTGSLRRAAQALALRPDLKIEPMRGNVGTRLKKLMSERLDAIILAAAGMIRLGEEARITEYLDRSIFVPAAGQGAVTIQARADDASALELVGELNDYPTQVTVETERFFLERIGGGCHVPVAASARVNEENDQIELIGLIGSLDGSEIFRRESRFKIADRREKARQMAERALDDGGARALESIRARLPDGSKAR